MGWTYEVEWYVPLTYPSGATGDYQWQSTWIGESFFRALLELRRAKKSVGAARLIWRG